MKSYSQAGQDLFAYRVLGELKKGLFLDVGANHPIDRNNTYGLEQIGWTGLCVDNDVYCSSLSFLRKCSWLRADATKPDVWLVFDSGVEYLSLDCDMATFGVLAAMPLSTFRFRVATIEHDAYRFGGGPRSQIRTLMKYHGYDLLCADVSDKGEPFEDWWVDPKTVDMAIAERYRCEGLDWKEVLRKGQA